MIPVGRIDLTTIGTSASLSMAVTYMSMASSISVVMQNASNAQQNGQQVAQAATVATCAQIVATGAGSGGTT